MTPKKQQHKKSKKKQQQSIISEAWENMSEDMAKVLPAFISDRFKEGKNKLWLVIGMTVVELIVLGFFVKFLYEWLVS